MTEMTVRRNAVAGAVANVAAADADAVSPKEM